MICILCTCTVTFEQGAFRQDVWSKRSWEAPETGAGAEPPKVFSKEEADRLEQERLAEYRGLTSGGEGGIMNSDYMMSATKQNPPNYENYTVEEDFESVQNVKRMMVEELGIPEDNIELSGIKNAKVLEPFMNRWKRIQKDTGMLFPPIRALEMINGDPNCIANFRASENVFYISSKYFNSEEAL